MRQYLAARAWARLRSSIQAFVLRILKREKRLQPRTLTSSTITTCCINALDPSGNAFYTTIEAISKPKDVAIAYCRVNDRYEELEPPSPALLLQLGVGFIGAAEWIYVITLQQAGNLDNALDDVEASHGCGNGVVSWNPHPDNCGCAGSFCIKWEERMYNGQRRIITLVLWMLTTTTTTTKSNVSESLVLTSFAFLAAHTWGILMINVNSRVNLMLFATNANRPPGSAKTLIAGALLVRRRSSFTPSPLDTSRTPT